ncbi:acetyl-CoA hydrolase/transferase family protein [Archaeoglobus fulgidus]|uniref:4-hydroxybutyrate CoA transferase (Cat2-2) n=1 Tax=Archaeoglobus fulgidus (strain ATCC 49558 / DSM 4304 / JCM 9628 / NBRC 100126 / VC-16) TaxID=224325 RepID=O28424_ARCFU|nr:acetyl-CoA hydrolase/transferase family protein [Archaeoglobus fulgidus]AAB89400.1 4-hydroxybutyrate CoA transferase (cat2-2) [Archaeoglobus fulgidus DSM 4304]
MDYQKEYERKLISPEEAANLVKDGMHIEIGGSANTALIIDKYLAKRKDELSHVEVGTFIDIAHYEFLKADPEQEKIKWESCFLYEPVRKCSKELGPCVHRPGVLSDAGYIAKELGGVLKGGKKYTDIAFLVTTPMDRHGFFNFGVTCTFLKSIAEGAEKVVVVVKKDMPWVNGGYDECIHISEVDYIVEDNEFPTPFLPFLPPPSKEDEMIAENIMEAGLIENGSTLQVGIGGLPNTVVRMLKEAGLKDLGIHTEMMGDGLMELMEEGIVTNQNKKLDRGKAVFSFALGTRKLYDFLDRNPEVATYPVEYTNNPFVVAQQPKMFSLNQVAQIDLMGQINSGQIGLTSPSGKIFQISGTGGQLDFVLGCFYSFDRQGKSVLATYSTYNGTSRIIPALPTGAGVTVPRSVVQYVATEWGIAYLRGLPIYKRAAAMIQLAHPDHRDWLEEEARKLGILPPKYSIPAGKADGVIYRRD